MSRAKKSPAEAAGFSPVRPWDKPGLAFSFQIGGKLAPSESSIGWAVMELAGPVRSGNDLFPEGVTDEGRIQAALTRYETLNAGAAELSPVELVQYTKKAFVSSQPHGEGMAFEHHRALIGKLRAAFEEIGAAVTVRTVS